MCWRQRATRTILPSASEKVGHQESARNHTRRARNTRVVKKREASETKSVKTAQANLAALVTARSRSSSSTCAGPKAARAKKRGLLFLKIYILPRCHSAAHMETRYTSGDVQPAGPPGYDATVFHWRCGMPLLLLLYSGARQLLLFFFFFKLWRDPVAECPALCPLSWSRSRKVSSLYLMYAHWSASVRAGAVNLFCCRGVPSLISARRLAALSCSKCFTSPRVLNTRARLIRRRTFQRTRALSMLYCF